MELNTSDPAAETEHAQKLNPHIQKKSRKIHVS